MSLMTGQIRDEFDFNEARFDDPDEDDDDDQRDEGGGSSSKSDGIVQSKAVQGGGDACISDYWERHDEDSAWYRIHVKVRKKFFGTTNEDLPPGGPSHEELDTHMRGLDAVGNWVRDDRHHAPNHRHFTCGFWTGVTILFDKGCAPHGRFRPKEERAKPAEDSKKGHKLHGDRIDYDQSADKGVSGHMPAPESPTPLMRPKPRTLVGSLRSSRIILGATSAAFLRASRAVRRGGGRVAFEWPRHCLGWKQPFMQRFLADPDVETVDFDGCDFGMQGKDGVPIRKQWKVATTSKELIDELSGRKCKHEKGYVHARIEGSVTPTTALYPSAMCEAIVGAWYPNGTSKKVASAMPVEVDPVEQRWKKKPNTLHVSLDSENAKIPTRATSGSAGLDTYASEGVCIPAGGQVWLAPGSR